MNRYKVMLWIAGFMLCVSLFTRLGLLWYEGNSENYAVLALAQIIAVGLIYDIAALVWLAIPFAVVFLLAPSGRTGRTVNGVLTLTLFGLFVAVLMFQVICEAIFWNEFSSRFNFIAVDYLLFTREVMGNIRQSYPVWTLLAGIGVASVLVFAFLARSIWRSSISAAPAMRVRLLFFAGQAVLLPALVFLGLDDSLHKHMTPSARELASNGTYSLFRAFRNNELSYAENYRLLDEPEVETVLSDELVEAHEKFRSLDAHGDIMQRHISTRGKPLAKNIVLVSIESLGSDYVGAFNGARGLTPNLDKLAAESLIFTNLYATGLRTVRGLEAITLSVPPTPGRAVPIRVNNKGLPTLGNILRQHGYDSLYLYGGYSIFDNMKDFFSGNGYTVIDRTAIDSGNITHETIWGVADEDLYKLALRELDARAQRGGKFFAHIMTTSNHRPYTYPAGRVSIPSHSGREGAVQYTDWAIGEFMRQAHKRPWFKNTVFVFVADHTSHGRGRIDLPPENYRIPLLVYSPGFIQHRVVSDLASQIDIGPTLLALLNIEYDSHFFGQNILEEARYHPRAFMANYLTVGYMEHGMIVELGPRKYVRVIDAVSGKEIAQNNPVAAHLILEAVSYYQSAAKYIQRGARHG